MRARRPPPEGARAGLTDARSTRHHPAVIPVARPPCWGAEGRASVFLDDGHLLDGLSRRMPCQTAGGAPTKPTDPPRRAQRGAAESAERPGSPRAGPTTQVQKTRERKVMVAESPTRSPTTRGWMTGHCCIKGRPHRDAGDLPVDCRAKPSNGRPVRLKWVVLGRLGRSPSARTGRLAAPGARDRSTQQCPPTWLRTTAVGH